ncbi:MAG: hypothetical protein WD029_01890 [Microthrixaceae bacterium]
MRRPSQTTTCVLVPPTRNKWMTFNTSHKIGTLTDQMRQVCEEYWLGLNLSGAVLLHQVHWELLTDADHLADAGKVEFVECTDWRLTANVLHRNREGLLHAGFPLLTIDLDLPLTIWSTDDPRIISIAQTQEQP